MGVSECNGGFQNDPPLKAFLLPFGAGGPQESTLETSCVASQGLVSLTSGAPNSPYSN